MCKQCRLPLGDVVYTGKDETLLHEECFAQFHARGRNEEISALQSKNVALKAARTAKYRTGWMPEQILSIVGPLTRLGCRLAPQSMGLCA